MYRLLLLIALLVPVNGVVSWYRATPGVPIQAPFPNSQVLILEEADLGLDPDNGVFYLNVSTFLLPQMPVVPYSSIRSTLSSSLPTVNLTGQLFFQDAGQISFSYPTENSTYCLQARSSPPLCPYLQSLTSGPYSFMYHPTDGSNTLTLDITTSGAFIDPLTGLPRNFLGAYYQFTFICTGTCESLNGVLPPAPFPDNITVRRSYDDSESVLEDNIN